ncbi:MAG TPA: DUF1998 domain-containing protein [Flavobacteriales bacterium]|nr:DUF1998 domain-containing protein [Flavobacteriales bacterium]
MRGKGDPGNDDTQGPVFAEHLFGAAVAHEQLHSALRGLLIARGLLDEHNIKHDLPRFRFHYFFRNIEGLWASVDPADVEKDYKAEDRKVGKLYASPRLLSEKGKRVLDLLYCERCETLLLGGMRSKVRNDNWELLSANNALDQAPHRSPNLMVQDRSHQEYAVFWPQGDQPFVRRTNLQGNEDPEWTNQTTIGGQAQTGTAVWEDAHINMSTGEVSFDLEDVPNGWTTGMLFRIVNQHNGDLARSVNPTHKALPCVCPACGVDYSKRRYKKTPIRSFRTGFGKSAELFATELVHQLGTDPSKRKLVAFSDSRDDAARLANAVEREHYEDLVRELLADVGRNVLEKQAALLITVNRAPEYGQQEDDSQAVIDALDLLRVQHHARFGAEAKRELSRMRAGLVKVSDLLKGEGQRLGALAERMAELGINPGGSDINSRRIWQGNALHHWRDLLRKQDGAWQWTNDAGGLIDHGNAALHRQVAQTFFGRLFYTAEAAGIGHLCVDPNDPDMQVAIDRYMPDGITKEVFMDILDATVRLLGDRYQYQGAEFDPIQAAEYDKWPAPIKRWVKNTAAYNGITGAVLGPAIFNTLVAQVDGAARGVYSGGSGLFIDRLCFKPSTPDQPIWRNARSQRVYLHAGGGVCTQEGSRVKLRPDGTVDPGVLLTQAHNGALRQQQKKHYLGHRAMVEQRQPARLRCEELTGQTDDQFERQRHFRDIVLENEGPPKMRQIDLLSVTTTLEVGVDIGDLQAVMQANMPPQRFNYQQRVGRAGRRGQAYSAVLTYCRGRSHDEHYFQHPERITGEPPPTPFLSMDQEKIMKRLLAKEVLRRVFKDVEQEVARIDEDGNGEANEQEPGQEFFGSNVHGEFGPVSIWTPDRKSRVKEWINAHRQEIDAILDGLLSGVSIELAAKRPSLKEWLTTGLLEEMDKAAEDSNLSSEDLSQRLAEAGILPMFGMPTSVRNLYHGVGGRWQDPYLLAIDRAEGMAVNEFAPGAQKTKDKAIHTAIGFTAPLAIGRLRNGNKAVTHLLPDDQHPFALHKWMVKCKACGKSDLRDPERDEAGEERVVDENYRVECSSCKEPVKPIALRSPRAYRTDLGKGNDAAEDIPLNLSRPPVLAITNAATSSSTGPNFVNELVRDAQTWRVNDNGERLFRGRMCTIRNRTPLTAQSDLSHQWIWEDVREMDADGYAFSIRQPKPMESIAIAAQKHTELVKLAPSTTPAGLTLDPFPTPDTGQPGNARSHAIRAAYYSAAFLLQRILADELDVDPSEIEVADLAPRDLPDHTRVADIILADELPNGSGFVRELHTRLRDLLPKALNSQDPVNFMKAVFADAHRESCLDSCYDCLRVYRNMNYHGLLDWRLGVSMLRLMQEPDHRAGADGSFIAPELEDWSVLVNAQAEQIAGNFQGIERSTITLGNIQVPVLRTPLRHFLIVHPFWNIDQPGEGTWLGEVVRLAELDANGRGLAWVDSFNLHRRVGWCYANFLSQ